MLALLTMGDWANAGAVRSVARISNERFMSLAPADAFQYAEALLHVGVDHVGDAATRACGTSAGQIRQLVLGADVAAQVGGLLGDQRTDACAAADRGEVAIAELVGLPEDLRGRVGVDGDWARIGDQRCSHCIARLHVAGDDDQPIVGLGRQRQACPQGATCQ